MGRYAGWIALHAGVAGGADVILIPEIPYDLGQGGRPVFASATSVARASASSSSPKARGRKTAASRFSRKPMPDTRSASVERRSACADELGKLAGKETRYVVLGHLQRGGAPTAFDRTLATRFGGKAVELVLRGQFGKMVANHPPELVPIPLGEVVGRTKLVPLDYDLLQTARMMGVVVRMTNDPGGPGLSSSAARRSASM